MDINKKTGCVVEPPRSIVIAQSAVGPKADYLAPVSGSEVRHCWPSLNERFPGVDDSGRLGLLTHYLWDENGIRIDRLSPRETPSRLFVQR
jgi:hypothetical protein